MSALTIPVYPSLAYAALLAVLGAALRRRISAAWWLTFVWWLLLPEIARVLFLSEDWDWPSADRARARGGGDGPRLAGALPVRGASGGRQPAAGADDVRPRCGRRARCVGALLVGALRPLRAAPARPSASSCPRCSPRSGRHLDNATTVGAPFWVHGVIGFLGAVVVVLSALMLFRPPADTRTLAAADEARVRTLLRDFGEHDSLGYFATRRDKAVVWDTRRPAHGAGRGVLPGGRVDEPGQRQPGRRPDALGRRDRAVASPGSGERVVAGGDGRRRGRRRGVRRGGADRLRDRRRGDPRHAALLADRPRHEGRAAVRDPAAAARLHHAGAAITPLDADALRRARRGGRAVARRRRRRARASRWRSAGSRTRWTATACWWTARDERRARCAASSASCRGAATGSRSTSCVATRPPTTGWSS